MNGEDKKMRKLLKKTGRLAVLAAGLSVLLGISAFAKNIDPMSQTTGSIILTMKYKDERTNTFVPVAGGNALLYKVADLTRDEATGEYSYVWVEDIENLKKQADNTLELNLSKLVSTADVQNGTTATLAHEVDQAVQKLGMAPVSEKTLVVKEIEKINVGYAYFGDDQPLGLGLYLIRQTKAASGYDIINSFLVTLPMYADTEDKGYYFDVDASPKPSITKPSTPPGDNPPDDYVPHRGGGGGGGGTPPSSTTPDPPASPDEGVLGASRDGDTPAEEPQVLGASRLPQTGQLKWPVSVMSILGLFFLLGGTALRRSEESSRHEDNRRRR